MWRPDTLQVKMPGAAFWHERKTGDRLLLTACIVLAVLTVWVLTAGVRRIWFNPFSARMVPLERLLNAEAGGMAEAPEIPVRRPLEDYRHTFQQRDIFTLPEPVSRPAPAAEETKNRSRHILKTLRLVGVVKQGRWQAVIEDTGRRETFFLYPGDEINGILQQVAELVGRDRITLLGEHKAILVVGDERVIAAERRRAGPRSGIPRARRRAEDQRREYRAGA